MLEGKRTCFYENNSKDPRMTNMLEFALNEITIWKYFDHQNIAKLYQILDDPEDEKECLYCVT
jgi:[calcium/calmodulin-dependent protein kinase] kinase